MAHKTETCAFVFDGDGVSIDPCGFANALSVKYGISRDETREFFAGPFKQCLTGNANLSDSVKPYLERWQWPDTVQAFIDLWMESDNQPNAKVLRHIQGLSKGGANCYLASNQEQVRANYIRDCMGFGSMFERLFFSCDLGYAKPDRQFFDRVAAAIECEPHQIHFWDDSDSCVQAARNAGWNAHRYENIESLQRIL